MSRQALWAILLLLGASAIVALMIVLRSAPEEQDKVVTLPLVQTEAFSVSNGPLAVYGSGIVEPSEEVTLGAQISGKLVHVNSLFREGSMVAKGAILFRIDAADYRNRVRSARADVAAQDVAVLQAQEEAEIAKDELRRFAEREAARGAVAGQASQILPPQPSQPLQQGSAETQGGGSASPTKLATREPQLRSARAARERAAAQLADARLALSRANVRAPFSGLVRSETAAVGTLVQPGQSLGTIVATDAFEVRVSLTENEAALIPGLFAQGRGRTPAEVFLDYGGQTYRWAARVDRADAILDPETRMISVFLRVRNPLRGGVLVQASEGEDARAGAAPPLLLGSFVRVSLTGASDSSFASIPIRALRTDDQVWIVRDGKLRIVPVRVIQRSDDYAYVSAAALGEGGQVVTSTLSTPVDGMGVRVEVPDQAAADE